MKEVQHEIVYMSWDYQKFPRHPVTAEKFEMRGRRYILSHYYYSVDTKLCKVVCAICRIICVFLACVDQIGTDWLPNMATSSQPKYARVDNFYHEKIHKNYND